MKYKDFYGPNTIINDPNKEVEKYKDFKQKRLLTKTARVLAELIKQKRPSADYIDEYLELGILVKLKPDLNIDWSPFLRDFSIEVLLTILEDIYEYKFKI